MARPAVAWSCVYGPAGRCCPNKSCASKITTPQDAAIARIIRTFINASPGRIFIMPPDALKSVPVRVYQQPERCGQSSDGLDWLRGQCDETNHASEIGRGRGR